MSTQLPAKLSPASCVRLPVRSYPNMPLTTKGEKILRSMRKHYGAKKGESVFYASANAKRITGVHPRKEKPKFTVDGKPPRIEPVKARALGIKKRGRLPRKGATPHKGTPR